MIKIRFPFNEYEWTYTRSGQESDQPVTIVGMPRGKGLDSRKIIEDEAHLDRFIRDKIEELGIDPSESICVDQTKNSNMYTLQIKGLTLDEWEKISATSPTPRADCCLERVTRAMPAEQREASSR